MTCWSNEEGATSSIGGPIAPGFVLSANAGIARASALFSGDGTSDYRVWTVIPSVRVQTFSSSWWYATMDAGFISFEYGGRYDEYDVFGPFTVRSPISRITIGFNLW